MRFSLIPIFSYFNRNKKYVAIHSTYNHLLPQSLFHTKHEVGAVVIYDEENDEFLQRVSIFIDVENGRSKLRKL